MQGRISECSVSRIFLDFEMVKGKMDTSYLDGVMAIDAAQIPDASKRKELQASCLRLPSRYISLLLQFDGTMVK